MKAPAKKTKAPVKTVAKPVGKTAVKAAAKTKPKAVARPVAVKAVVKPASKQTAKPAAAKKPVPKSPVKPAAKKPAAKAKPVAKPAPKKPAAPAKVAKAAKPVKAAAKAPAKAPAKPPAKAAPKAAAKPVKAASPVKAAAPAPAPVAAPVVRPAEKSSQLPPPPPLKPGRRSSARAHAQMPPPAPMVPTHAPDAAKASYSTMTERVIAPPPHVAAKKDPKLANNWKTKSAETLTDEEVKAMPDSEYMNEKQMAFFRHKLSILKQDIHNSAGETTEHLREDTVVVPDPADRATIEEEHALELRTRDRERKLLKKIEQSIARIDSGDYGYCDETGEPIGVGRLIARPTANLSLEAQQRRELKQKMFGD
ncbi:RNA polymerase-binding protein DksA [Polaromonas sp.]|uniref:RNA polymerase-binding protein DksA n=1 Tax=Polaromonas sp. TaxID=1869339 RepID=UPI0025DD2C5E|nr:RNA polymerase-binding protein DksA [Polaromonas sp.]